MDTSKARELLSILADGIDPFTGEILPEDHVCNEPDMIRALHLAVQQLGNVKTSVTRSRPENAGKPWSEEDDRILCEMFERGCKRKEMKEYFKRTGGAIIARLEHLGWTIVNKKDTIFKYIFWERLDSLPIPEGCFHFIRCQIS